MKYISPTRRSFLAAGMAGITSAVLGGTTASCQSGPGKLMDHAVILDEAGRLQPWTTYEHIITGSMDYIKHCPTVPTAHGDDPWYLVTSELEGDGSFQRNQNNQGGNAYYAVETLRRYLARTDDREAITPVRLLLDRVLHYHTPADWAWPGVPRTQDDSPDGCYTDTWSEPDKMSMVGTAYLRFAELTGDETFVPGALQIADTLLGKLVPGEETRSPLPFRVNLETGEVLDPYTAGMVFPVIFFEALAKRETEKRDMYLRARDALWDWVLTYPVRNNHWSGYYEDVKSNHENLNQQLPMETARYMLEHLDDKPEYAEHIPALIEWVRLRFGETKQYGATSVREQDVCFKEMSSHTSRYASVVAGWWDVCERRSLLNAEKRAALHEEARASLALCSYSTWSRFSKEERSLNYTGLGFVEPWFSDSYFDFLPHVMDAVRLLKLD